MHTSDDAAANGRFRVVAYEGLFAFRADQGYGCRIVMERLEAQTYAWRDVAT